MLKIQSATTAAYRSYLPLLPTAAAYRLPLPLNAPVSATGTGTATGTATDTTDTAYCLKYISNQLKYVLYHMMLFCGFVTQWFSSEKDRNRAGMPRNLAAVNASIP